MSSKGIVTLLFVNTLQIKSTKSPTPSSFFAKLLTISPFRHLSPLPLKRRKGQCRHLQPRPSSRSSVYIAFCIGVGGKHFRYSPPNVYAGELGGPCTPSPLIPPPRASAGGFALQRGELRDRCFRGYPAWCARLDRSCCRPLRCRAPRRRWESSPPRSWAHGRR